MFGRRTNSSRISQSVRPKILQEIRKMADVSIRTRENGPFLVTGPVTLIDHLGNAFELGGKETIASAVADNRRTARFGDGAHKSVRFRRRRNRRPPLTCRSAG